MALKKGRGRSDTSPYVVVVVLLIIAGSFVYIYNSALQSLTSDNQLISTLQSLNGQLQNQIASDNQQVIQLQNELAVHGISETPTLHSVTLLSQDQVISLSPGAVSSWQFVEFSTPSTATGINVTGSYASPHGSVDVAILTPTQLGAFEVQHSLIASDNVYWAGDTRGAAINAMLSPGTYYLVFYDPGLITTDTVTVGSPITLQYTS